MTDADHRGLIAEDPGALGGGPVWDSEGEADAGGDGEGGMPDEQRYVSDDASRFADMLERSIPRGQPVMCTVSALKAAGHPVLGDALASTWFALYNQLFEGVNAELEMEDRRGGFTFTSRLRLAPRFCRVRIRGCRKAAEWRSRPASCTVLILCIEAGKAAACRYSGCAFCDWGIGISGKLIKP
jgi:hypothetical protein